MADLLADSNAWLEGQRHSYLSSGVVFKSGLESVSLSATIGKTDYQAEDSNGSIYNAETVDFVIRPEDLGSFVPKAGDRFERVVGNKKQTYEVWTPTGEDLYIYDSERLSLRVHTQLIEEVDC